MLKVADIWGRIQAVLFPHVERCFACKLTDKQRRLIAILEIVRVEEQQVERPVVGSSLHQRGRVPASARLPAEVFDQQFAPGMAISRSPRIAHVGHDAGPAIGSEIRSMPKPPATLQSLETLFDLDTVAAVHSAQAGIAFVRAPVPNADERVVAALAKAVAELV